MSTKFKSTRAVPLEKIIARLKELSEAITKGGPYQEREFTIRIPAECDRDADLVIAEGATRLQQLQAANRDLQAWFDDARAEVERVQKVTSVIDECLRQIKSSAGNSTQSHNMQWISKRCDFALSQLEHAKGKEETCIYPDCQCPFDMGPDHQCLKGLPVIRK